MGIQNERETKEMNRKHKDYKLQLQKRRLRRRRPTTRWKKCNPVRKKKTQHEREEKEEKKEKEERKMKEKNHYYNERNSELLTYESWRLSVKSLLVWSQRFRTCRKRLSERWAQRCDWLSRSIHLQLWAFDSSLSGFILNFFACLAVTFNMKENYELKTNGIACLVQRNWMTIDGWIMKTQIENNNSLVNDCYDMNAGSKRELINEPAPVNERK